MSMWWASVVSTTLGLFLASSAIRWSFVETFVGLEGPFIFRSYGSVVPAPAFPPRGSSERFPRFIGTTQAL